MLILIHYSIFPKLLPACLSSANITNLYYNINMSEEVKKGGLHIHIGGLIILVIILLILFKVDIKSKIDSPQFQKNLIYVENVWKEKIVTPIKEKLSKFFIKFTQKEFNRIEDNLKENVFKVPSEEDINYYSN